MANVSGQAAHYSYTYTPGMQPTGYSTSPTGPLGSVYNTSYQEPAAKQYNGAMLASYTSPSAPQYSSGYCYAQQIPSISYGMGQTEAFQTMGSTGALYNSGYTTGPTAQSHLQGATAAGTSALSMQAQQLAAANALQRGYQSPPYHTGSSTYNTTGPAQLPSAAVAAAASYNDSNALYKQAQVYSEHIAQAVAQQQVAVQQAAIAQLSSSGFQQKLDVVNGYSHSDTANRLQILNQGVQQQQQQHSQQQHTPQQHTPQPHAMMQPKQLLRSSHMTPTAATPTHHHRTSRACYSRTQDLDSLQTPFSEPPPPPPPRPPPSSYQKPHILPTSRMGSLSLRDRKTNGDCSTGVSGGSSGERGGSQPSFKRSIPRPGIVPFVKKIHLCEICKVSCASSKTYKDHVEGQRHKKREALKRQQKEAALTEGGGGNGGAGGGAGGSGGGGGGGSGGSGGGSGGASFRCVLCEVTCTGDETFNAHMKGVKHYKAEKLYKELGKEVPPPEITGNTEPKQEVPIVGANLIEIKSDSTKSTKVIYHCKMCDCTFNDDLAKNLHLKGRRHRLNYKKQYDPSLRVEVQPSKREKLAEQKARRRADEAERRRALAENRWQVWEQYRWRAEEEWHGMSEASTWQQYDSLRKKLIAEYEERVRREKDNCKKMGLPEPAIPPPPHLPPPPPRQDNGRFICPRLDEFLVIQKQTIVSPTEEHLEALQNLVAEVESRLRAVSETVFGDGKSEGRIISTMHKTGDLAKAILLSDNLHADIAVLCSEKPTLGTLHSVFTKFKARSSADDASSGIVLELQSERARFRITRGGGTEGTPSLAVNVRLTSPTFDHGANEEEKRAEITSQVLDRKHCLQTMSDVNEAGWYRMHLKPNTPAVIVLRMLSSLRQEPSSPLSLLSIQALQVLVFKSLKTFSHVKSVAPTLILRRLLEILSVGAVLQEPLPAPWQTNLAATWQANLVAGLSAEDAHRIIEHAQYCLRCIAFGQIHKVLLIPPPPNPPPICPASSSNSPPATTS